jgi:hypothetical protein
MLTKKWEFRLFFERKNESLLMKNGIDIRHMQWKDSYEYDPSLTARGNKPMPELKHIKMIAPKGTVLKVDRLYVRQNGGTASDFDSMTFRVTNTESGAWGVKARFWAKLDDCNTMECEVVGEPKTKASMKEGKGVTDEIKIGDVVKYDYVACKNAERYVTRSACQLEMLVIGQRIGGHNWTALRNTGEFVFLPKDKVFLVKGHTSNFKKWMHESLVRHYCAEKWLPEEQEKLKNLSDAWVTERLEDERYPSGELNSLSRIYRLYREVHSRMGGYS